MRLLSAAILFSCLFTGSIFQAGPKENPADVRSRSDGAADSIVIDYPLDGSVFPPEITPPTLLWRDGHSDAKRWVVEVSFADHTESVRVEAPGDFLQAGEIDPAVASDDDLLPAPEHKVTRTWRPDADTWARIKEHSTKSAATIVITGFSDGEAKAVSSGKIRISTSPDPVGAPIFYRDVPLLLSTREAKGSIQPLPPFAIPLIKWRLRNIGEAKSRTAMENLPTCANCHSFSAEGRVFGLDLDGPKNDKGLYALVPVEREMTIRNENVIRWSSFLENRETGPSDPAVKRFGFMSQVSPDGRYVVTSIGPPGLKHTTKDDPFDFAPGIADRLFSMNYNHVNFTQVFYPTRGILAWYDRKEGKLKPLPGADDPNFVQSSAFWSPDGKYLIFSRAVARDPYPAGAPKPEYAGDPRETQIQYDLYRIPFNEGQGGKAEPVVGASQNGMSNNFPKVSPDGRWIVFVQNRNGLLMRPDSKLYIVPFKGGKARLMECNTSLMNSWHSFSPNGRWLAFSSKARSAYTQLMLTHIDDDGRSSPPILVENATAANRAVNIPEFVNVAAGGMEKIDPQATEFYRLFNLAYEAIENKEWASAVPLMQEAVDKDPQDAIARFVLATALSSTGKEREAAEEYQKACMLDPRNAAWAAHLAVSRANTGDLPAAIASWRRALELNPSDAGSEAGLGTALFETGQAEEGYVHLRKAIEIAPGFPDAHNHLGWELAKTGQYTEAVEELKKAVSLMPTSMEYHANLGYVMTLRGDFEGALPIFRKAVELSKGKDWRCLDMLAYTYNKVGRFADAVQVEREALDLAVQQHHTLAEKKLRENLDRYEREGARHFHGE